MREWWLDPPEDTRDTVFTCDVCGEEIKEGDSYFDCGQFLCEECGDAFIRASWKEAHND